MSSGSDHQLFSFYVIPVLGFAVLRQGKWLYATGLPGKSGVGGGLIAVSPGKFGIAVVSPPLDDAGNSVKAQKVITDISNALGGNPYAQHPESDMTHGASREGAPGRYRSRVQITRLTRFSSSS